METMEIVSRVILLNKNSKFFFFLNFPSLKSLFACRYERLYHKRVINLMSTVNLAAKTSREDSCNYFYRIASVYAESVHPD